MARAVATSAREPLAEVLERAPEPAAPAAVRADAAVAAPHRIVVVGGGAGGLVLATKLGDRLGRRGKARITLVDCALTHVWKPLLHEVAAGTLRIEADGLDYFAHARDHHFAFELGRMSGLDRRAARNPARAGQRRGRRRAGAGTAPRLRHAGDRGRQRAQRLRRAGRARALPLSGQPGRGRAHPPAGVRPLSARPPGRLSRGGGGCASRSSARARPGSSSPPSCAMPRASWSATACAASIPTATSRCA